MKFNNSFSQTAFAALQRRFQHSHALARILGLVEAAGCKTVVEEVDPSESEAKAERKILKLFDPAEAVRRTTVRFHFFRGRVKSLRVIRSHDSRYLGYCDVRSAECGTISGALIDSSVFAPPSAKYVFLICQRDFQVKFGPRVLQVRAFPYMQEDHKVIRCAESALASLARYFGIPIDAPAFTMIGRKSGNQSRPFPSKGLNSAELRRCVAAMGMVPERHDYRRNKRPPAHERPEQIIYRYVESGIPVLVGFATSRQSTHAVVIVGHTFNPDSWMSHASTRLLGRQRSGRTHHSSTTWVERFVVQDDEMGPYTLAPADLLRRPGLYIPGARRPVVIVPLKTRLPLTAEMAESVAGDLIPELHAELAELLAGDDAMRPQFNEFWFEEFSHYLAEKELVLRTSLMSAETWKDNLRSWAIPHGPQVLEILQGLRLPRMVWVVEISWPSIFLYGRRRCGEMVLSAEANPPTKTSMLLKVFLWLHVPGVVVYSRTPRLLGVEILRRSDAPCRHRFTVLPRRTFGQLKKRRVRNRHPVADGNR
jgi:hypothetical protein